MAHTPPPKTGFVETLVRLPRQGGQRWTNAERDRIYEWDGLHGEWEVYNNTGFHLGAADSATGVLTKKAVRGRKIDV